MTASTSSRTRRRIRQPRFAAVDERKARLFSCTRTSGGALHVEELAAMRSAWEDSHERGRPSVLKRGPASFPPQEVDNGRSASEETRHFAKDVAAWLREHAVESGEEPLIVFSAPRFLGVLRATAPDLNGFARFVEGELTPLRPSELAEHPMITKHVAVRPRATRT